MNIGEEVEEEVEIDMPAPSPPSSSPFAAFIQNNKKYLYIAGGILAVIAAISLIAIIAYYLFFTGSSNEPNFDYGETVGNYSNSFTLKVGPGAYEGDFTVEKPPENMKNSILIHSIEFSITDEEGEGVEVERLFVNSLTLSFDSLPVAMLINQPANHSLAMQLPIPYILTSVASSQWSISLSLINLWSSLTSATLPITVHYTLLYSDATSSPSNAKLALTEGAEETWKEVKLQRIDDSKCNHAIVSGAEEVKYECNVSMGSEGEGEVIVQATGAITPGGLNLTLYLLSSDSSDSSLIASSIPSYSPSHYILSQQSSFPLYSLNSTLSSIDYLIQYFFSPSPFSYSSASALFLLYVTSPPVLPSSPSPSPSPSPTPIHNHKSHSPSPIPSEVPPPPPEYFPPPPPEYFPPPPPEYFPPPPIDPSPNPSPSSAPILPSPNPSPSPDPSSSPNPPPPAEEPYYPPDYSS